MKYKINIIIFSKFTSCSKRKYEEIYLRCGGCDDASLETAILYFVITQIVTIFETVINVNCGS